MEIFSINGAGEQVLCDTPTCYAEVRRYRPGEVFGRTAEPRVETVLCAVEGELTVDAGRTTAISVGAMQGVHIPAGQVWSAVAGTSGAKVLRVDSLHPGFDPSRALMPALQAAEHFAVASGADMTYTDYFRCAVLNFAPGFIADKHFHQEADEVFWFFSGIARVTTPAGEAVLPEGSLIVNPAGEWHIIANDSDTRPLLMFLTVTPNIVPSHTFFDAEGKPVVRSMQPLTHK